jgi:hypothetical protein
MTQTTREKLATLMQAAADDQKAAIVEAGAYLESPEATNFLKSIEGFRERTLPGSHVEQIFDGVLNIIQSVKTMTDQTIAAEKRIQEAQAEVDKPAAG